MSNILFLDMHFNHLCIQYTVLICMLCTVSLIVCKNHSEAGVCVTFLNKYIGDKSGKKRQH